MQYKDEDGVLSLDELNVVMKCFLHLNPIFIEIQLLCMVRYVSEDKLHNTIEFNEFLLMMSKQKEQAVEKNGLVKAFK